MTGALALIPIVLAAAIGFVPLWMLLRGKSGNPNSRAEALLVASLAFPTGAGLISIFHFIALSQGAASSWIAPGCSLMLGAAAWFAMGKRNSALKEPQAASTVGEDDPIEASSGASVPVFGARWLLWILAIGGLLAVVFAAMSVLDKSPHGAWDSWAIWTLRAKFLAGGAEFWRNAIDPGLRLSHPEYPLLSSSFIAWSWRFSETSGPAVPQMVAVAFLLSVTGMLGSALTLLRGASVGLLAVIAWLSPVVVVTVTASLYADLPIGVYFAGACLLLVVGFSARNPLAFALLGGVFTGFCAWTKEEGLMHLGVITLVLAGFWLADRAERSQSLRRLVFFLGGAMPIAGFIFWFRTAFAPYGEQRFSGGGSAPDGRLASLMARALDPSRYGQLVEGTAETISTLGPWLAHPAAFLALAALLLGIRKGAPRSREFLAGASIVGLAIGGYSAAFLLVPGKVESFVNSSLHRILLHVWPAFVAVAFLPLQSPEDLAIAVAEKPDKKAKQKASAEPTRPAAKKRK